MGVHEWAKLEIQRCQQAAGAAGYDEQISLRALLSAVVQQSQALRSPADLAQELLFLAENLDEERDYSFMRP